MGQAQHNKKQRKIIRKTVHEEMGTGLEALGNIVRPRPKWIPKLAWTVIAYWPLFRGKHLRLIYKHLD